MKPYLHAEISVRKFGGFVSDYLEIHNFLDSTKAHFPDMRHRAILHNSWGIFLAEKIFGVTLKTCEGKIVQVRDVAEQHILDDLGFIPTLQDYLLCMEFQEWMVRPAVRKNK